MIHPFLNIESKNLKENALLEKRDFSSFKWCYSDNVIFQVAEK